VAGAGRRAGHHELQLLGPTECTIDALSCRVVDGMRPVWDGPLAQPAAYVLDDQLRPVPIGVVGELYLAGGQIARGLSESARV